MSSTNNMKNIPNIPSNIPSKMHAPQKDYPRSDKISELIQRYLTVILRDECRDPRLGIITILAVKTTHNLALAKVYFSVLDDAKSKDTVKILNKAAGFFRSELARKIHTKSVPRIEFVHDTALAQGNRIEELLAR
jgi:ribosome-binding factor A